MDRYSVVYSFAKYKQMGSSPVMLEAGNILKDNQSALFIAHLNFINISDSVINSVSIGINEKSAEDENIFESGSYVYSGLECRPAENFGTGTGIPLRSKTGKDISFFVTSVLYNDGRVETFTDNGTGYLSTPTDVSTVCSLADFCLKVGNFQRAQAIAAELLSHSPTFAQAYVIRLCADLGIKSVDELKYCSGAYTENENYLNAWKYGDAHLKDRLLSSVGALTPDSQKNILDDRLKSAVMLIDKQLDAEKTDYAAVNEALAIIKQLNSYFDCSDTYNRCSYQTALKLKKEKQYNQAADVFAFCDGFSDSHDQMLACRYSYGRTLLNTGDVKSVSAALTVFEALAGYYDSGLQAQNCRNFLATAPAETQSTGAEQIPEVLASGSVIEAVKNNPTEPEAANAASVPPTTAAGTSVLDSASEKASKPDYEKPSGISKKTKLILISAISLVAAAAALLLVFLVLIPTSKYTKAQELFKKGKFDEAISSFEELGNFKDSGEQVKKCKYNKGLSMMNEGELDQAALIFSSINDYSDSADKQNECIYLKAVSLKESQSYKEACEIFASIPGYKDADEQRIGTGRLYAKNLAGDKKFTEAIEVYEQLKTLLPDDEIAGYDKQIYDWYEDCGVYLYEQEKYSEAIEQFDKIPGYNKNGDYYLGCKYHAALSALDKSEYEEAKLIFLDLGDFKDSKDKVTYCDYLNACDKLEKEFYADAGRLFLELGEYNDSNEKYKEAEYCLGSEMFNQASYKDAAEAFAAAADYSDAPKRLLDSQYKYCTDNKNSKDKLTYEYLLNLIKENYNGALEMYNDLYVWTAQLIYINYEKNEKKAAIKTVNRYCDYLSFGISVTGGPPTDENVIDIRAVYPGSSKAVSFSDVTPGDCLEFELENGLYSNCLFKGSFSIDVIDKTSNEIIKTFTYEIDEPVKADTEFFATGFVDSYDDLSIRCGPDRSYSRYCVIPDKSKVAVYGKDKTGNWYYVYWSGREGWVLSEFVDID